MKKLIPFLWFDGQAEEAAKHYVSIFKGAKMGNISRYGDAGPGKPGSVLTASFEILGLEFVALNGGPQYKFTEAISFQIPCETQEEVDHYWNKLGEGGNFSQCGWLKDKFGVSWQVVPTALPKLLGNPDKGKASRVMQAMLKMQKLDIPKLEAAARG